MRISLELYCKWRLKDNPHYVFTTNPKLLVNTKSGKVINQVMKGSTIGYVISGKFQSLSKLRPHIELIPNKENLPF